MFIAAVSAGKGEWRLEGYDTFEEVAYPLEGTYGRREEAEAAAEARLAELERSQPTATSGGQNGIQDRIFLVSPDGARIRYYGSGSAGAPTRKSE